MTIRRPRVYVGLAYGLLAVASLLYIGGTLYAPIATATHTYSLSPRAVHTLELTIVLPIIAVWFTALWGSLRFKRYAISIYESADGKALNTLANGLLTLVSGLVATSLLQSLNAHLIKLGYAKSWTIFSNYFGVVVALVAFAVILRGAYRLAHLVEFPSIERSRIIALALLAIMGVAYVWLLAMDPYRQTTPDPLQFTSYYLPDWLLLSTVVLPYLLVWYGGLMAVIYLRRYQNYSPGIIYHAALKRLSWGLMAVIVASVLIQLVVAIGPSLHHAGLGNILLLLYGLIIIYAIGHVLVAIGARKLAKIEQVQ
ncbi:MAG TPA: hypothetical protein VMR75_01970 [Candidatus Saccharimonadales bacterium]|nr:hypothetical protein [Candidatus Saccharimonadales bacterium]